MAFERLVSGPHAFSKKRALARHLGVTPVGLNRIVMRVRRAQRVGLSYTVAQGRPIPAARHGA